MRVLLNGHEYAELIKSKETYRKEAYDEIYKQLCENQTGYLKELTKLLVDFGIETKYPWLYDDMKPFGFAKLQENIIKLQEKYKLERPK